MLKSDGYYFAEILTKAWRFNKILRNVRSLRYKISQRLKANFVKRSRPSNGRDTRLLTSYYLPLTSSYNIFSSSYTLKTEDKQPKCPCPWCQDWDISLTLASILTKKCNYCHVIGKIEQLCNKVPRNRCVLSITELYSALNASYC